MNFKILRSILLFLIIIIISTTINYAQEECPPKCVEGQQIPDDAYKNADFYSQTDPTLWDYNKVQWNLVPPAVIPNVPPENIDIKALSDAQKTSLTIEQWIQGNNLFDAGDIANYQNAFTAVNQRFVVDVTRESGAGVTLSADGLLRGSFASANLNEYPQDKYRLVLRQGQIVIIPKSDITKDGQVVARKEQQISVTGGIAIKNDGSLTISADKSTVVSGFAAGRISFPDNTIVDFTNNRGDLTISQTRITGSDARVKISELLPDAVPPTEKANYLVDGSFALDLQNRRITRATLDVPVGRQTLFRQLDKAVDVQTIGKRLTITSSLDEFRTTENSVFLDYPYRLFAKGFTQVKGPEVKFITHGTDAFVQYSKAGLGVRHTEISAFGEVILEKGSWKDADFVKYSGERGTVFSLSGDEQTDRIKISNNVIRDGAIGKLTKGIVISDGTLGVQEELSSAIVNKDGKASFVLDRAGLQRIAARYGAGGIQTIVGSNMVVEDENGKTFFAVNLKGVVGFEGTKNDVHLLDFQAVKPIAGSRMLMLSLSDEALFQRYGQAAFGSNWQQAYQNLASLKTSNPALFNYITKQNPKLFTILSNQYGDPSRDGVPRLPSQEVQNYLSSMAQSNSDRSAAADLMKNLQDRGIVTVSADGKIIPAPGITNEQLISYIDANRRIIQSQISAASANGKSTKELVDHLNKLDLTKTNIVMSQKAQAGDVQGAAQEYQSFRNSHSGDVNEQARLAFVGSVLRSGNMQQGVDIARNIGDRPTQDYLVALNLLQRGESAQAMLLLNRISENYPDSRIAGVAKQDIGRTQDRYLEIIESAIDAQIGQVDKDFASRVPEGTLGTIKTLRNPVKSLQFFQQYFTSQDYADISNEERGRLQRLKAGVDAVQLMRRKGLDLEEMQNIGGNKVGEILKIDNDVVSRELARSINDALQNPDVRKLIDAQKKGAAIGQFDFQTGTGYADTGLLQQTWVDTAVDFGNGENLLAIVAAPAIISAIGKVGATVAPTIGVAVPTFMRAGGTTAGLLGREIGYVGRVGEFGVDLVTGAGAGVGVDIGTQEGVETLFETYRYYATDLTDDEKDEIISSFATSAGFATSSLFILPSGKAAVRGAAGKIFGTEVEEKTFQTLARKYDEESLSALRAEVRRFDSGEVDRLDFSKFGVDAGDFKAAFREAAVDPTLSRGAARRVQAEAVSTEADNIIAARKAAASDAPIISEETTWADLIRRYKEIDGARPTLGGEEFVVKVTDTGISIRTVREPGPPELLFRDGDLVPEFVFRTPLKDASDRITANLKLAAQQKESALAGSVIKPRENFANGREPPETLFDPDAGPDLPVRSSENKNPGRDDRGEAAAALEPTQIQEARESVNAVGLTVDSLQGKVARGETITSADIQSLDGAVNTEFEKLGATTVDIKIDTLTGVTSYPHGSSDMIENMIQRGAVADSTTDLLRLELKELTAANGFGHEVGDDLVKKFMQQSQSYFREKLGREVNVMRGPNGVLFVQGRISPGKIDVNELESIITKSLDDKTTALRIEGSVRASITEIKIPKGVNRKEAKDILFEGLRETGAVAEYVKVFPARYQAFYTPIDRLEYLVQGKSPKEVEAFLREYHNYVPPEIEEGGIFRVADQIARTRQAADDVLRLADEISAKGTATAEDMSRLSAANKALETEQARLDVMASRPPRFESEEYDHMLNFKSGADLEKDLLTSGKPMFEVVGDLDWLRILLKETKEVVADTDYARFFKSANDELKSFEAAHPGSTARLIKQANSDEYRIVISGVSADDAKQVAENIRKSMEETGLSIAEFDKVNKVTGIVEGRGSVTTTLSSKFEDLSGLTPAQLEAKTKEYDGLVNLYKYAGKNVIGDGTLTQAQAKKVMVTLEQYARSDKPTAWKETVEALQKYSDNLQAAGIDRRDINSLIQLADNRNSFSNW